MTNSIINRSIKERFDKWWERELDSPLIWITCNFNYSSVPYEIDDPGRTWFDPEFRIHSFQENLNSSTFIGDSFPFHFINFGPGILAGFLGAKLTFDKRTMWIRRTLKDYALLGEKYILDKKNFYWKKVEELTELSLARSNCITSITDIGGVMDVLAGMRGSIKFMKDLLKKSDEVKHAIDFIKDSWFETFQYFSNKILSEQGCMVAWNGIYSEKPTYPLQNDFSAMISPKMYKEFSLKTQKEMAEKIERTVYHLDGPNALRHLDSILSIKDLNSIQWVPGAGAPGGNDPESSYGVRKGMLKWIGDLKKIKEKGKSIELYIHPKDAEQLIEKLGPNLLLKIPCKNPREGKEIYKKLVLLKSSDILPFLIL